MLKKKEQLRVMNQFEDMHTFVRIVEAGSITKAAEQLNTVKSAISRRLTGLEARLGVSLLTRTTRTQTLTEHGESYYQQCLRIITDVEETEALLKNAHSALSGTIKIAAPLSFGLKHLHKPIRAFQAMHPNILLDIDFNDRKVDLVEEGFDLAIRIANLEDSTLIAKRISQIKIILCASPDYLAKHAKISHPHDLFHNHVKLHYKSQPDIWPFTSPSGEKTNVKVPQYLVSNNGDFLCQAAIAGAGLIYTPDFICYQAVKSGQLIPILSDHLSQNEIPIYAVYPQTRHLSQRVRQLVDFLASYYGDVPYWQL